ncbi:MAG: PIG-L family deacetylase [Planctomycetota bacterium]|nr:PIG-L family deacetylase [Planctomycetota bacterium]
MIRVRKSVPGSSPVARSIVGLATLAALLGGAPVALSQVARAEPEYEGDDRVEEWKGKTILVVTPHPDDETFSAGGTLAKLARNGNRIQVLIYTTDNAGSNDPEMTRERLAAIRKKEEEDACELLGIPKKNITWLGYDDGMLEYVDRRKLTKQVAREIRRHRPDAVFSIDPGATHEQWHKSDHRSGALITVDAMRAAAWRLYFPELEKAGFKRWSVPVVFFFYSAQPNYTVDITDVAELKAKASAAHTSQFGSMVKKYDGTHLEAKRAKLARTLLESRLLDREKGRVVEKFRRSTRYGG